MLINIKKVTENLNRIKEKKKKLENAYFSIIDIFNKIIQNNPKLEVSRVISNRKKKLDNFINSITLILEKVQFKIEEVIFEINNRIQKKTNLSYEDFTEDRDNINNQILIDAETIFAVEKEKKIFSEDELKNKKFFQKTKQVFLKDDDYQFQTKIKELEVKLNEKLERIETQINYIESQNELISNKFQKQKKDKENKLSFDNFGIFFSNIGEQLENVSNKIANTFKSISLDQLENLEKLSLPLIKSLETTLTTLTNDLNFLRKENIYYRNKVEDYKEIVNDISKEKQGKELEFKETFNSLLKADQKLNSLEKILINQSNEINNLNTEKNLIIEGLENKLSEISNNFQKLIFEKEILVKEKDDLIKKLDQVKKSYENEKFLNIDTYVESISLQDLVSKETDKIIDLKIQHLINKFQQELEEIKNNIKEDNTFSVNNNFEYKGLLDDFLTNDQKNFEKKLSFFEEKIAILEDKLKDKEKLKTQGENLIYDLHNLLSNIPYTMINKEKDFLTDKFKKLEKMVETSLKKVKKIEDEKNQKANDLNKMWKKISEKEMELEKMKNTNQIISQENVHFTKLLEKIFSQNLKKLEEIEDLLVLQEHEFLLLNEEKNNAINLLIKAVNDNDLNNLNSLNSSKKLNKYDFVNFIKEILKEENFQKEVFDYIKDEVDKIVAAEKEILQTKYKQNIENINEKYQKNVLLEDKITNYFKNNKEQDFWQQKIKDLVAKNYNLEEKITDLENKILAKTKLESDKVTDFYNPVYKEQNLIKQEIEKKLENLLDLKKVTKEENQKYTQKKVIELTGDNNFKKEILCDEVFNVSDNFFAKKEIIESTSLLLNIQKKLLNLEKEIVNEEKKIISSL